MSRNSFLFPVTKKTGGPNVFSKGIYKPTIFNHLDFSDMGKSRSPYTCQSRRPHPPGPSHAVTLFNSRFGSACFGQGRRRAARYLLRISPLHLSASILRLRTKSRLLLNFRHGPCNLINLVSHVPCRATGVPAELSRPFLAHLGRSNHPVSQRIYSCLSLRPSYLVGSKWSFEHNVVFSDPAGFRSLRSPENRHYVITLPSL